MYIIRPEYLQAELAVCVNVDMKEIMMEAKVKEES
jgi:hypothetical protein